MHTVEPGRRGRAHERPATLVIALGCLAAAACATSGGTPSAPPQAPRPSVLEQRPASDEPAPNGQPAETKPEPSASAHEQPAAVGLLDFLGIGRGERVADLGAGAGYSISLMADAVGPAGVVYARHDPRTLTALPSDHGRPATPTGSLPANIVVMQTTATAPFSAPAKGLHLVTVLFAYRDFGDEGVRRRLNDAAFRALLPGGHYVVAEHAPSVATSGAPPTRIEARVVQSEVEAAGFRLVESAELLSSTSRAAAPQDAESSQYLIKFRKPL